MGIYKNPMVGSLIEESLIKQIDPKAVNFIQVTRDFCDWLDSSGLDAIDSQLFLNEVNKEIFKVAKKETFADAKT